MRKNAIIVLSLAALFAAYQLLIAPIPEKRTALKEKLEADYMTLARHERAVERAKAAGAEAGGVQAELGELEKRIVHAKDKPLAFAELQARIQDIATSAGLRISSIKLMPTVSHPGYTELPIDIDSTGDIGNLSAFLNAIDSGKDLVGIKSMDVSLVPKEKIRAKMVLSGLMKQ